ncbi:MAG: hypothetical protein ACI9GM_001049 [Salibacteraceae bacterium]|jgi:hypothetical protein
MYPCDDELLVSELEQTEIHNAEHNGHEHEQGADYCSPFCVCNITHVQRNENFTPKPLKALNFESPNFIYLAPFSTGVASDIFQPPRA